MAKIYKGNPFAVQFTIYEENSAGTDVVVNITSATVKVYYRSPVNATGSVNGSVLVGASGTMTGTITAAINITAGTWTLWPSVVLNGETDEYEGETISVNIYETGY